MQISESTWVALKGLVAPELNMFRAGTKFRCRRRVAMSTRDPLSILNVEALLLEAEVLQEESDFLILDARARAIFARAARLEAHLRELGVAPGRSERQVPAKPSAPTPKVPTGPIPEDRFVDQRDGLLPKQLYLRLAREEAFPSSKIGKRVVARWGDVRAAIEARQRKGRHQHDGTPDNSQHRNLDVLRRELSLNLNPKKRS